MIAFSKYFNFNAEDVEYIEASNYTYDDHPYHLKVKLKSGNDLIVYYTDSKSRDAERNKLIRLIDQAWHEDPEKILNQLSLLNHSNKRIEKRQRRIWRILKSLLNISTKED